MTTSLRSIAAALGATDGSEPISAQATLAHLRWLDGWQGAGPLSARAVRDTTDSPSLRPAFASVGVDSLKAAYAGLGFSVGGERTQLPNRQLSLREAARRTASANVVAIRLLSYNTYLLPGVTLPFDRWVDDLIGWDALAWFGIPFGGELLGMLGLESIPGIAVGSILKMAGWSPSSVIKKITTLDLRGVRIKPKPALDARTAEIGPALAEYDLCCLCEVWEQAAADQILSGLRASQPGWQLTSGPDDAGELTIYGSGLRFLSRRLPVTRTDRLVFTERGDRRHDSDAWTNKGALFNAVDTGFGDLEIFQTHLYYGCGLADAVPDILAVPLGIRDPHPSERSATWHAELAELAAFIQHNHQPGNVAIVTGDFNLDGTNLRDYAAIREIMDPLRMRDAWAWDVQGHSPVGGHTARYTDSEPREHDFAMTCGLPGAPDGTGTYCDDAEPPQVRQRKGVGRFDYLFVLQATPEDRYQLEVSRIRRRPFRRHTPSDGEEFLSDHLGLDTTLYVSARQP
jgi:hypothetical protein